MEPVFNLIWLAPFGSRIAVGYLVSAVLLGITIIGASGFRPATSQAAPPGAVPLGARAAPVVTVCPRIAATIGTGRWFIWPRHLICAQDPAHPAGDATLAGRCPQAS